MLVEKRGKVVPDVNIAERVDPPRKHDLSFYIVLIFGVAPLWSIVPLSWVFVVYAIRSGRIWTFTWQGKAVFAVALCEVLFSVYYYHLSRVVSGPSPYGPGNLFELQAAFTRVLKAGLADLPAEGFDEETLDTERPGSPAESIVQLEEHDPRALDFRNSLRVWFGRVPWSSIRLDEVRSWLYWSIFNDYMPSFDSIPHAHRAVLDETIDLMQKRAGCTIPDGSNLVATPMRLTLDKVNISFRPFLWYAFVGTANWLMKKWFARKWNVHYGSHQGLDYLIRVPESWDPAIGPRPIVFMHGLGLGLFQYHVFLLHLLETLPDRPLLVPLQPHISQDILHPRHLKPMDCVEATDCLAGLLSKLGWVPEQEVAINEEKEDASTIEDETKAITLLSHSNGSYTHAWVLKRYPKLVARSCFVDPVTFCSWEGDVCYNFIYRPCRTGIELIMRYFVGTELGVANVLQRHFDWSTNSLFYEEIPNARDPKKTFFLVGGKDDIVNAERVKKYLTSHGIRKGLWFDPDGRHGQALITGGPGHTEILRWLREDD